MTTPGSQVGLTPSGRAGQSGGTGPSGAGAQGLWQPSDNGLLAWTTDPMPSVASVTSSAGIIYVFRVKMSSASTIGKVGLLLRSTAPAGLANTFAGVYSISGATATLLEKTADISSTLNGVAAAISVPLASTIASQSAGTNLLIAFLAGSATTMPTFLGYNSSVNAFIAAKQDYRAWTFGTAQTALPSTMDLSSGSAGSQGAVPCLGLLA